MQNAVRTWNAACGSAVAYTSRAGRLRSVCASWSRTAAIEPSRIVFAQIASASSTLASPSLAATS